MFLPRSVQIRSTQSSDKSREVPAPRPSSSDETEGEKPANLGEALGSEVNKEGSSDSEEESESVVAYSKLQRWPSSGEPVCVVCGRYGAYIVDRTDQDVCSLECKARHLLKMGLPLTPALLAGKGETSLSLPASDRDELDLREWSYRDNRHEMTADQVNRLRSKMRIKVDGEGCPRPISDLSDLGLPMKLLSNLRGAGYETLTPVQMQVIPAALHQRDLLICAATGSGKTLSFLLPILLHLLRQQGHVAEGVRSPRGLILTPTRELAMQIEERAKQLMRGLPGMRTALVVGGMPVANQLHRLKSGVELVVCTPARLNDIIENHPQDIELADVEIFVVDEVDCMLSMGFETQNKVAAIYQSLPVESQFHLQERANSPGNLKVKKHIKEEILLDKENNYLSSQVDTAIKRYFESRKRLYRESKPDQQARVKLQDKQRKTRSRRQRLFDRRKKFVKGGESTRWQQLTIDYMSLESSEEEDDHIVVHHLPWRSDQLNEFIAVLDQRADKARQSTKHYSAERKQRKDGSVAATTPPLSAPKWAVHKDWRGQDSVDNQDCDEA